MNSENLSYHEARAEEELARAENATTPGAVRAHVALADLHLDILYRSPVPGEIPAAGAPQPAGSPSSNRLPGSRSRA